MAISKAVWGTSAESSIKTFSRTKDGRGAFLALIATHASDVKYRAIVEFRNNLLTNIKWTGRSYPLDTHIADHRQAVDDPTDCAMHVQNQIPNDSQRVEYLIDSITCQDGVLQAAIGNIRADTNNMRSNFEATASHMLGVDSYKRISSNLKGSGAGGNKGAQTSDTKFTAGRR